ncbi:MAG TPA: TonB-dependent receptor [Thermoanaerobaculia bacterium]|nr:TonB-dependent receptor [Thermoanaerobaculia bacterium]
MFGSQHCGSKGKLALLAVLFLALAGGAAAQTDVTTSRISGVVNDGEGAGLPGVTVEARNSETGLTQTTVTNEEGFFRILNLPSGIYTVSATLEGFNPVSREEIRLLLGSTPTINFTLTLGTVAETITVTTSDVPLVEVTNTSNSTTIQTEQIEAIPINGRDFKSLVLLTPETRLDTERGNLSLGGQRGINTNVTIDGVDFNNAFFGGTVGGAEGRAPLAISQEAIKEFSVITNGASVEFGRSGGGFVNVITKNGTNNLNGSLFYYNQPQDLISDFADGREPADQEKEQYGFSLGGPIVRDRLFYFLSYDNQDQSLTIPIQQSVLDADIFGRYPELASPSEYVQTRDGDVAFGRVDYQANDAHRFLVRANFTDYEGVNGTSNAQGRTESYNGLEGLDTEAYVASWSGQFGSNMLNDLNINYITEDTPREDKGLSLPEIQLGTARYGEVSFLPIESTTERNAFGDTFTYLLDEHILKAGVEYNDTSIDQVFRGNWRGVFIFNNEADLLAGRWAEYRQFGGLGGLTSSEAGRAAFSQKETAFFLQDQWFVRPNLTVTAGVRVESLDNPNDPVLNANDVNANGSFGLTGDIPDSDNQISPRLGIAWAPDQKTAVRFSAGRFWARTPAILFAQLFTSNGLRGTQYIIRSGPTGPTDPLAPEWGPGFDIVGVERIDFTRVPTPARPGVFTIDEDFENSYTDRFTLGVEREVFALTTAGLDFTYAEGNQLQRLKDANRVYSSGPPSEPGAPPTYSSTLPNPFYGRITNSVSDGRSEYMAATLTVNRRLAGNFSLYGAVTWSEDKDNDSNERNFAGIQAEDYNDLDLSWGYSSRDQRWKGVVNGLWETPWWGLGVSGAFTYNTGFPYTATTNLDSNNDGERATDRPTVNGVHFERNSFRQPDFYSLDLRLSKAFAVGPGDLALSVDCFNCTDAENRFVPGTDGLIARSSIWGTGDAPLASFGAETGVGTPRTLQVSLRYDF